jgi:hypothetical protein
VKGAWTQLVLAFRGIARNDLMVFPSNEWNARQDRFTCEAWAQKTPKAEWIPAN